MVRNGCSPALQALMVARAACCTCIQRHLSRQHVRMLSSAEWLPSGALHIRLDCGRGSLLHLHDQNRQLRSQLIQHASLGL